MREILRFRNYRHFKGGIYSVMGISLPITDGVLLESFKKDNCNNKPLIANYTEAEGLSIEHYGNNIYTDTMCHDANIYDDVLVVYVSLTTGVVHCRPYGMFVDVLDKEQYPGYSAKYRFELINDVYENPERTHIYFGDEHTSVTLGDSRVIIGSKRLLSYSSRDELNALPIITFSEIKGDSEYNVGEIIDDLSNIKFINERYSDVALVFENKKAIEALRTSLDTCEKVFTEGVDTKYGRVEPTCE